MTNARPARALVLSLWAGFFAYLWVSREMVRLLGPRTYWVVPFGCITLGTAAVAHFVALKTADDRRGMSRSDLLGIGVLLIPIVAAVAVPQAQLGALAAARKAPGAGAAAGLVAPPAREAGRPPNFIDVHFANESDEYAASLGIGEGTELELTGFVSESSGSGAIKLTRFYVSCCAADALPYSVTVATETGYEVNSWLRVSGALHFDGDEYVLAAETVEEVPEPDNPYLY